MTLCGEHESFPVKYGQTKGWGAPLHSRQCGGRCVPVIRCPRCLDDTKSLNHLLWLCNNLMMSFLSWYTSQANFKTCKLLYLYCSLWHSVKVTSHTIGQGQTVWTDFMSHDNVGQALLWCTEPNGCCLGLVPSLARMHWASDKSHVQKKKQLMGWLFLLQESCKMYCMYCRKIGVVLAFVL